MIEKLPAAWCSQICTASMSDKCLEECAVKRDCSGFAPKNLKLEDMPRFPQTAGMTKEEKFTSVAVYIAKITDYLKGEENGDDTYYSRSRQVPKALQKQGLLFGEAQRIALHQNRQERESVGSRSARLDPKEEE